MTAGRLLHEASSYELEEWKAFLALDYEMRKEAARRAREDAEIMGND